MQLFNTVKRSQEYHPTIDQEEYHPIVNQEQGGADCLFPYCIRLLYTV